MDVTTRTGTATLVGASLVCLGAAVACQVVRDRVYAVQRVDVERILYVRSGSAVKRLALDFDALAADAYWIRAIQHYGGDRLDPARKQKYELLFPLLDHTTTLDPYFTIAYRFGAIFLSEKPPGGPARPDLAITLLRKGIAAEPAKWEYYHDVAFVYYWHLRDFAAAATWFQRAADQPGAPAWLRPMAASMLTAGNDRQSARFIWSQMLQSDQDWLRANAERSLMQLDAMDAIDQIRAIVQRFPPPPGESYSWEWLMRRGILRKVPEDPTGTPFTMNPATGEASVSDESRLFPMPDTLRKPIP